jgi:hypothetical protein
MGQFDRGSKWLIERHGDALLRLAGIHDIVSWRPLPAEVVQPAQLPDGLLEAQRAGRSEPELFVLEIASYPERRVVEQLERDVLLVLLNQRELPEAVAVVLHPKGNYRIPTTFTRTSGSGETQLTLRWRVVELWTVPAAELIATEDLGLIPWALLGQYDGEPEPLFRRCREIIDAKATEEERWDLLAVTQILARLRYNDPRLFEIFGGSRAMLESPMLDELKEEWTAQAREQILAETRTEDIRTILRERFEALDGESERLVRGLQPERLDSAMLSALRSHSLTEFKRSLEE